MENIRGIITEPPVLHDEIVEFELKDFNDGSVHCISLPNFRFPTVKIGQVVILAGERVPDMSPAGHFNFARLMKVESSN